MKKASVVIQARMGSSRLPGKVLMLLAGKPVLEHVVRRCQCAKLIDRVIVATTIDAKDIAVVNFAKGLGVDVFCGSVEDILDRYYQAAKFFELKDIVRITADCPVIDPDIIDLVIERYFSERVDYAANILQPTYPDGEDVEVFGFDVLERAWREAHMLSEREHVTPYIRNNDVFKKISVTSDQDLSSWRWTLDEEQDYEKLSVIFDVLYKKDVFFHMKDILKLLKNHPEVDKMNADIMRNEGYQKSLDNDRKVF